PPSPKSPKSSSPSDTSDPSAPSDLESFLSQLRHADLLSGSLELLDKDLLPCLVATNIQLHTTNISPEKIAGLLTIERLVWKETLVFENLSTPFTYTNGQLSLPSFTASLGGGPVKASFAANLHSSTTTFTLDASFAQTNLDTLAIATGGQPGKTSGIANSQLHLSGPLSIPNQIIGPVELSIADAQFSQLGLFQSIGKALNSRELADLRIQSTTCNLLIANSKASITLLKLDSPNLHITADQGSIGFDKKIDIPAQLFISKSLLSQLPDLLKTNFTPTENDQSSLPFKITGTTDKVSTNLIEKLTGIAIPSQLIDVLSGFLNPKNRDDEKKKKAEDDLKKEEKKRKKEQAKIDAQSAIPPANP
ncbi:MAG: AsmA-like C-terminal region-containing protein, partial [Verrucomicrobiota bacterium]